MRTFGWTLALGLVAVAAGRPAEGQPAAVELGRPLHFDPRLS